jgi:hypothetical protein
MATSSLRVHYRPVRLGWCVRENNWDDLRLAIRLTHTLWGGRFNPIIPVDNLMVAASIVELYGVDILIPVADEPPIMDFVKTTSWLPWSDFDRKLFLAGQRGTVATFLDIYHVVRDLLDSEIKDKADPKFFATLFEWDESDPLKDVFLAYFGAYPAETQISKDYFGLVEKNLRGHRVKLATADHISSDVLNAMSPSALTTHLVEWDSVPHWGNPGIYVGEANNFEDVVSFWNLRAADVELVFYDPQYHARFQILRDAFVGRFKEPDTSETDMAVWSKEGRDVDLTGIKLEHVLRQTVSAETWDGFGLRPTRYHLGREKSALGTISETGPLRELSFQLPEKPFFDEPEFHQQKVVVSVSSLGLASQETGESTFQVPFLPALNEFCGRRMLHNSRGARVEPRGIRIIESVTRSHLRLQSIPKRALITEIFRTFGMKAEASAPGRIASRLIEQMDGIQGCRVFKIPGVRDLLEAYGPQDAFERANAINRIGRSDPQSGVPNFSEFENLFIESREGGPLKPEHVFLYLVKNGVFQVGLTLSCPHCELDPWIPLDDIATEAKCEFCGKGFLITAQLRDRNWKYRRSGLFGRKNSQEGSIPVVLTLQQLDTVLSTENIFVTNMTIEPNTASIEFCEVDFVLLQQGTWDDRTSIAIGECKTRKEISEEDVQKLSLVADAFELNDVNAFIVFSKLAPFTPEEIMRCRAAQLGHKKRVIMLTDRELEPYFVYERTEKEFVVRSSAISLDEMAEATDDIFLHPKPRSDPG